MKGGGGSVVVWCGGGGVRRLLLGVVSVAIKRRIDCYDARISQWMSGRGVSGLDLEGIGLRSGGYVVSWKMRSDI